MMVEMRDILQFATPVVLTLVGWGVKLVWSEIKGLRAELKEFVRQETCAAHRQAMEARIKDAVARLK